MYENEEKKQRAILVSADCGEFNAQESIDELEELTESAGAEVITKIIQQRSDYDKATLIGKGKLAEIKEICKHEEIDIVIFDHELTAANIRNLEEALDTGVIDRTMLILDIFAKRANTAAGKLQVELAQYRYRLPRLEGMGKNLSKLGGGIGTRGPGESKLESDKRHIKRQIESLEKKLKNLVSVRKLIRDRRKKEGVTTVALVGYTNVGKSTILNKLTDAGVLTENKLFATLDPTSRALQLPDGRNVMLIDTVGFVRRLPHHLVEAFKSTLEETTEADLLLNVCDISSNKAEAQTKVTIELVKSLGAEKVPMLTVFNKYDLYEGEPLVETKDSVFVSAITGEGLDRMLQKIGELISPTQIRMNILIPYGEAGILAEIREEGKVFSEEYIPDGIKADALVDIKIMYKIKKYEI